MAKILVTGAAGFIGAAVSGALLARGDIVLGVDNLSDYYDVRLKDARLARLAAHGNFSFRKADIADKDAMLAMASHDITFIVHLAAQPASETAVGRNAVSRGNPNGEPLQKYR